MRCSRIVAGLACVCLSLVGAGCSDAPAPLTQIVVVVDSDMGVPSELDALSIEVSGALHMPKAQADLTEQKLPRSLGLVHEAGPLGPIHVTVRGLLGGTEVVQRLAVVSFKEGQSLQLRMPLAAACLSMDAPDCSTDMTCDDGSCVSAKLGSLPTWSGKVKPFDVGGSGSGGAAGQSGMGDAGSVAMSGSGGSSGSAGSGNQPPTCNITRPADAANFGQGETITFVGACNDPEAGALSTGLRWESDKDGSLGMGVRATRSNLSVGQHDVSLCATDPADSALTGCAHVAITVESLPPIGVSITSLMQGANTSPPFATDMPITASASSMGVQPLTLTWIDSLAGNVGNMANLTLTAPLVGKHVLTASVTDARSRTATDSRTFAVLAAGQSELISAYTLANSTLATGGSSRISALTADVTSLYFASANGVIYRLSLSDAAGSAVPTPVQTVAPASVHGITLHEASSNAYVSLSNGVESCSYSPNTSFGSSGCTTYSGSDLPSSDVTATLRLSATNAMEYLFVGTKNGLLVAKLDEPNKGQKRIGHTVNAIAGSNNQAVWFATSEGLYTYNLASTSNTVNNDPRMINSDNAPSNELTSVAVGTGGTVWVGSRNGLGRYVPNGNMWTTWRASSSTLGTSLASNDVRAIAVARGVNVGGTPRDVIWVATAAGVSRFDPSISMFTTFTTADGLPSNDVLTVTVLPNGDKVFGTDTGIAVYTGL